MFSSEKFHSDFMGVCNYAFDMDSKVDLISRQKEYIEMLCEKFGFKKARLAVEADLDPATITRIFNEKTSHLSSPILEKLYLRYGIPFNFGKTTVPVTGFCEMGRVMFYAADSELKMIEAPTQAIAAGASAIEIKDQSMWPRYKQGEYALYVENKKISDDLFGKDCLVELEDGSTLLRILQKGAWEGIYILEGYNSPSLVNIKIKKASLILGRW